MKLSLRHLFIFTFSVLGAVIIGIGGYLLWLDRHIDQTSMATIHALKAMESAQNLEEHLFSHKRNHLLAGLTNNVERLETAEDAERQLHYDLKALDQLGAYSAVGSRSDVSQVHSTIETYLTVHKKLREQGYDAVELYRTVSNEFDAAYASAEALIVYNVEIANQNQNDLESLGKVASAVGGGIVLLAILAIGALAIVLRGSLFEPLAKLRDSIVEMRKTRSFAVRAPLTGSSDVQQISGCLNELSADLETHQQSQFRFIATIAHDIRNPLSAMSISAELLEEEIQSESAKETLAILKGQVGALQNIVKDLLEQSSLEAGDVRTECAEFDLNDIVAKCVSLSRLTTAQHDIRFSPLIDDAICFSDRDRLTQVMNNLLSNAIKYSPDGGEIHIELLQQGERFQILVHDAGIGIPEKSLQSIFYPFQRSANAKQSAAGTGLGLFSCKRIIKALGGEISARSTLGKGSTFIIELPLRFTPSPLVRREEPSTYR